MELRCLPTCIIGKHDEIVLKSVVLQPKSCFINRGFGSQSLKEQMAFHGMGLITLSIKAWEQSWQFSNTYLWLIKSLNISHLWADCVQSELAFLGHIFINIYAHCISFYTCTLAFHAFLNLFHTCFFYFLTTFL